MTAFSYVCWPVTACTERLPPALSCVYWPVNSKRTEWWPSALSHVCWPVNSIHVQNDNHQLFPLSLRLLQHVLNDDRSSNSMHLGHYRKIRRSKFTLILLAALPSVDLLQHAQTDSSVCSAYICWHVSVFTEHDSYICSFLCLQSMHWPTAVFALSYVCWAVSVCP